MFVVYVFSECFQLTVFLVAMNTCVSACVFSSVIHVVVASNKSLMAKFTLVRFLASVYSLVDLKPGAQGERLSTHVTLVSLHFHV